MLSMRDGNAQSRDRTFATQVWLKPPERPGDLYLKLARAEMPGEALQIESYAAA